MLARFDWLGPLQAAGAAVLLLGLSLGVSVLVHAAVGEPVPGPSGPSLSVAGPARTPERAKIPPPRTTAPEPAKTPPAPGTTAPAVKPGPAVITPAQSWQARPDPEPKPVPGLLVAAGPGLPVSGNPLFAARGARFVVDTPERGLNYNTDLAAKEGPLVSVFDVSTGRPVGTFPKTAYRSRQSLLSPDGRYLVTQQGQDAPNEPIPLAVWHLGADKPAGKFSMPGGVFWLGFATADEVAVLCCDRTRHRLQVWSAARGVQLREFPLSPEVLPPPGQEAGRLAFRPNPLAGAVSPGGKYVALGGPTGIALVALADGRHLGSLPLAGEGGTVDYRGMRFSDDGAELLAVVGLAGPGGRGWSTRLRSWKVADGTAARDVGLKNPNLVGPPLPGLGPDTVFLTYTQYGEKGKIFPLGQVVDAGTGATLLETPYAPVCWLADGRLLAVGPLKDAPAGTQLPHAVGGPDAGNPGKRPAPGLHPGIERLLREDPSLRAVYPVPRPKVRGPAAGKSG
jgi:hypothetical protein